MALNYSSKHDISYANYNNKNIPWKLNASIISQNNQINNPSLNLGAINNNLVIESSQNDILFFTSQNENKKVIVKNNMAINNLDVSNNLKTKLIDASSISLNNILYFPSLPINIIGDLKVDGAITVIGSSSTGLEGSKTQFINSILRASKFTDVSIIECDISDSSFNNVNIINSYIYAIPNGYGFDKSNNSYPNKANFSDVSLQRLVLDSSLNSYINFAANASNSISIRSYDDYSKLVINKPLTVGIGETISNISNISNVSIFYGTISCNTLYYSQLVPDIRLNNYFDVSIGLVSISGNNIPVNNSFNIGSSDYKFNEIISTQFSGDLSGTASSANDLKKNLDMSFNNLDIYGTFTLNRKNLNQFLSGDLISIIAADVSFIAANNRVRDLSISLYSNTGFDLCLNSNFTKISLRDTSFDALNNKITSISASVYSKSDFDLCLNRNVLRNNDLSAIAVVVTNPGQIYNMLGYIDSSLNKVTNAKVSNELAFPYAITYVDDNVEDTNIKESYLIKETENKATTTITTKDTVIYTRTWKTTATTTNTTLDIQPDNASHPYVTMQSIRDYTGVSYRRKWYDVPSDATAYTVFRKITTAHQNVPASNVLVAENSGDTLRTWEGHRTWATSNSSTYITYNLVSIKTVTEQDTVANFAEQAGFDTIFIGAKRKAGSSAGGRTSNDWEWSDGSTWSYTNFSDGFDRTTTTYSTSYTGGNVPTKTNRPADYRSDTPSATYNSETSISQTNVKLPLLVSSNTGSIVATSTAVSMNSLPAVRSSYRVPANDANNIPVSGFGLNDPDTFTTNGNSVITRPYSIDDSTTRSNGNLYPNNTTDTFEYIRTYKYTYDTYSYVNSYYGLTTGSFKISDNSNNNSNYISSFSINTIPTTYSCIAITGDGMFVALGKASEVTVYMKTSTGWIPIGSSINVNFTAYTGTGVGIIPTQFTENWRKNLKNLAINFNYNTGSATSQLLLAFGDTINIIKVYSYSNGTWSFSNGIYSVTGGSWGNTLTTYSATTLSVSATTNFGYFVTLSQSPSVLGFTVDDRFYTYNCTTTNNSSRGSPKTLPISFSSATKNIVAFKMSSDADKIIVSNTHYVFIYKWINTDFSNINNISYLASAITFNYGSFTNISAAPRSLDISNISTNECVFAIGFPDVLIDISANRKSRGYVEYWKLVNNTLTRLAILVPRKRDFNNSSIDTDEYFFSAGGIKITNANTILVAPNFKFHFNSTNKKYELDPRSTDWTTHNSRSTGSRLFASIQNEVENELVKICARNNSVWIGGKRVANPIDARGKTSIDWEWVTPDPWIYQNFRINQPDNTSERGLEFTNSGWNDWSVGNSAQAIFMTLPVQYSLKNTFTIFDNRFYFHSSGFSSTYCPNAISSTVIARWYSRSTSTNPTNSNTINFSANGRIVSNSKGALTLSDIRLKENIVDTTPKLADLLKVRVVNYNLKGSDGKKLIGVIAQELEQLFPSLVKDGELSLYDINHGKTESYKSVKYSCFDIILIKAFQEQMAIINKLSSQLDEIEGKTKILKAISEELALLKSENELFKLNINEILKLI